jgi:esterase/lipase superfamily enzyme
MMRVALRVLPALGCIALLLAGCGGRPEDTLLPVAAGAPGGATVDLLVATTRAPDANPARMYTGERDQAFNFADIKMAIPPDGARTVGEVQWPSQPPNPAREFVVLKAQRLDEKQALRTFHDRLTRTSHRRVLVFVHGYNTRFGEAVFRLAQIAHDSKVDALPVLFTWPSRGRLLAYTYDRESANYSRDALEQVLQGLARDPAVREISVLAHSMGNLVTLEALRQMAIRNGAIAPKIKSVMLAAPDVDVDVFRRQIVEMGAKRPPFTLFVAQNDEALAISSRIWGGTPRIGMIDPRQEPYRTMLAQQRINVLDLTDIKSGDSLGHTKFAESPQIVQLIGTRLAAGQTLGDGHSGLGDRLAQITTGAAATVGTAAGVALSAPIAIVDGRTRDNLDEQLRELGTHVQDTAGSTGRVVGTRY